MGFTYPDKFTNLNTFVIQVAQRCSDNGGPTVFNLHIERVTPPLDRQYTPLQEALKPTPSIPCYNTQVNAMKQLLY